MVCPLIEASILTYGQSGGSGVGALLRRAVDYRRVEAKVWLVPALALVPAVMLLTAVLMRWLELPIPAPSFSPLSALLLFCGFFFAAIGEETGWSGYVIDPLQHRWGALRASLVLGSIWAVWHVQPLVQAQRSATWIAGWALGTVPSRVLIVWLYNNATKSVFVARQLAADSFDCPELARSAQPASPC